MKLSKKLILASNSPRRKEILLNAGFEFSVIVKEVDESFPSEMIPIEVPQYLAQKKAEAFVGDLSGKIILTADTIVAIGNEILNKPSDKIEAKVMLKKLSGKSHQVFTGFCILTENEKMTFVDETIVYFKKLSDNEIDHYIEVCKPFDKAGAYGVQDFIGMIGIEKIEGSYFTVMGLPIHKVYEVLQKFIKFNDE